MTQRVTVWFIGSNLNTSDLVINNNTNVGVVRMGQDNSVKMIGDLTADLSITTPVLNGEIGIMTDGNKL